MPRNRNPSAKTRLSLEVTERVRAQLEASQKLSSADSMTDVMRNALGVYHVLLTEASEPGAKVVLRKADGTEAVLVFPWGK